MNLLQRTNISAQGLVMQALEISQVLRREQLEILLSRYTKKQARYVLNSLKNQRLIWENQEGFFSLRPNNFSPSRVDIAAFWVYLDYANEVDHRFSRGRYPAEIIFTINNINFEIIVCGYEGLAELGHLRGRMKPLGETKYIIVFQSDEFIENLSIDLLPEEPCLIASVKYNGKDFRPEIQYFNTDELKGAAVS